MKAHKLIMIGLVYLVTLILLFFHFSQVYPVRFEESLGARRVKGEEFYTDPFIFGTYIDVKGTACKIIISNTAERLEVRAEAEDGSVISWARIDKSRNTQRATLNVYFENKQEEGAEIEAGLGALLFKVIIGEARKEKIRLLKINLTETITRIFLETFSNGGYIINLKFYPQTNPVSAIFGIPLTPGTVPIIKGQ